MYKMLVLDVDGTLISSSGQITEADKEAVRAAEDAGVKIVIGSARPYPALKKSVLDELALSDPYVIAGSGSSVWRASDNSKFFGYLMTVEQVKNCVAFANKYGYNFLAIKDDGDYYAPEGSKATVFYEESFGMKGSVIDFEKRDCDDCCKVMLFTDPEPEVVFECMERMKAELPDYGVSKTWINILEFYTSHDIKKEIAMAHLAELLGIDLSEIVAVGDDIVDIGMIKAAGLGVAMGNAGDAVKAEADFITRSNDEGGVAHVVNSFILNQE